MLRNKALLYLFLIGFILIFFRLENRLDAQEEQTQGGLDIIFAIDTSGSMYYDINNYGEADSRDMGANVLQNAGVDLRATDSDNLRFSSLRTTLSWLSSFAVAQERAYGNFPMSASVVSFNNSADILLDWTPLNGIDPQNLPVTTEPENSLVPFFEDPAQPTLSVGSDFLSLYSVLEEQLDKRESRFSGRTLLFVITDSVPCARSDGQQVGEDVFGAQRVRDNTCNNANTMANHISSISSLDIGNGSLFQHIIFIQNNEDLSSEDFWSYFVDGISGTTLNETWRTMIGEERNTGRFTELSRIEEVPNFILETILEASAQSLTLNVQRQNDDGTTAPNDYSALGVYRLGSGNQALPYYQESGHILVLLSDPNTNYNLENNGTMLQPLPEVATVTSPRYRHIPLEGLNRPGDTIELSITNGNAWIVLQPARVALGFRSQNTEGASNYYQYQPMELTYTISDGEGTQLPISSSYELDIEATLQFQDSNQTLTLSRNGTSTYSAVFVPSQAGRYFVSNLSVRHNNEAVEDDPIHQFLKPDSSQYPQAQVQSSDFSLSRTPDGSEIARSSDLQLLVNYVGSVPLPFPLGMRVTAELKNEETDSACLISNPNFNDAILPLAVNPADESQAQVNITFTEAQACRVAVTVSYHPSEETVVFPTLSDPNNVIDTLVPFNLSIQSTTRVSWALLKPEDNSLLSVTENDGSSYIIEMNDVDTAPLQEIFNDWPADSTQVVIRYYDDERSRSTANFNAVPFRFGFDPEASPENNDETLYPTDVPFSITLSRDGTGALNLAEYNPIAVTTDTNGTYFVTFTGLEVGQYVVSFQRREDLVLNPQIFEYAEAMPNTLTLSIVVEKNELVDILRAVVIGTAIVILLLLLIAAIFWWSITREPLGGSLQIYALTEDEYSNEIEMAEADKLAKEVQASWIVFNEDLITNRNRQKFFTLSQGPLFFVRDKIHELQVKTAFGRDKGSVNLRIKGNENEDKYLKPEEAQFWTREGTSQEKYRYCFVKLNQPRDAAYRYDRMKIIECLMEADGEATDMRLKERLAEEGGNNAATADESDTRLGESSDE